MLLQQPRSHCHMLSRDRRLAAHPSPGRAAWSHFTREGSFQLWSSGLIWSRVGLACLCCVTPGRYGQCRSADLLLVTVRNGPKPPGSIWLLARSLYASHIPMITQTSIRYCSLCDTTATAWSSHRSLQSPSLLPKPETVLCSPSEQLFLSKYPVWRATSASSLNTQHSSCPLATIQWYQVPIWALH